MSNNFQDQFYSNIIVYDERKRYYYLWARKNKPLLDDEIRNSQLAIVDQVRRSLQHTQGDVSVPLATYSRSKVSNVNNYFSVSSKDSNGDPLSDNDIRIVGGSSVETPAVMFVKGFYVFLTNDIIYSQQNDTGNLTDADFTETQIPDLTTPIAGNGDRVDIVYVDLHFGEVSSLTTTEYEDPNLKNPIVGTETANRLRAVFDIRVWEDYPNKDIDGNTRVNIPNINEDIFTNSDFLGSLPTNDFDANPLYKEHFRVPIAILYRKDGVASITDNDIIDLLSLYDKRVLTLEEITYRSLHGGYGETSVYELMLQSGQAGFTGLAGYTGGLQARFPHAKLDEGAYATGLNQGFETEAFNTDSVTPRVLDSDGKFAMGSLLVGREDSDKTYPITSETGPVDLADGEAMANQISAKSIYVGYDRGITGLREYQDRLNIHMQGLTGTAGLRIINETGETGSISAHVKGKAGPDENNVYVDYLGRMGINTAYPGWTAVNTLWNTSGDNIVLDVNDSVRIWRNQFIKGDQYIEGGSFGQSWQIPSYPSGSTPGLIGFTGLVNQISGVIPTDDEGITGRAAVYFKPGIAVVGSQNVPGYTGNFGFYEAFDSDGGRVFTIGSLGEDFDRTVRSLFGVGFRSLFLTDYSLLYLPDGYGQITGANPPYNPDKIEVTGFDYDGNNVSFTYEMQSTVGITGVFELGQAFEANFPQTKAQIILDPFDEAKDPADRAETHGQLIIKDLQDRSSFHIKTLTLNRDWASPDSIEIPWTESKFFGSGTFGGDVLDLKLAKLDLGEAADAWLFNGDVFFNGTGELNRVTFSPNVLFRNDVFVYGNFIADSLLFNFAKVNSMQVNNQLKVDDDVAIGEHLVLGYDLNQAFAKLNIQTNTNENLTFLNNGDIMSEKFIAQTTKDADDADVNEYGSFQAQTRSFGYDINLKIGGTFGSTSDPLGFHLIDSRFGITLNAGDSPDTLVFDYSNGSGEYGTLNVRVRGNLRTTQGIVAANLSAGSTLTEPNTDYSLFVSGDSRINGTLTVEQIKYTGSEAAEDDGIITTPPNVNVIQREQQFVIPPQGDILRTKKFSLSTKALLNNKGSVMNLCGAVFEVDSGDVYQSTPPSISEVSVVNDSARFAHDNLTYTQEAFAGEYTGTASTELIASQFTSGLYNQIPELFRRNFDRITIATLGTLRATYVGFVQGTDYGISNLDRTARFPGSIVQSYEFESRYFRNKSGGSVINWLPSTGGATSSRFNDENLIAKVEADIIGTNPDRPEIYHLDKPIAIFLPISSWERYCIRYPDTANSYTYAMYYPVERIIQNFTKLDFEQQTSFSTSDDTWYLGLYPELNNITSVAFADSNSDRLYRAEWDLNLVVYSETVGKCSNLIGNINVSYMQG